MEPPKLPPTRRPSTDGADDCSSRSSPSSSDTQRASSLSNSEIVGVSESSASRYTVELVDVEAGVLENGDSNSKNKGKIERDCRICHMGLDSNEECGAPIELGCACKHDLAAAHKNCAEAWFKIRGNRTCEICGSVARNVAGANEAELLDQWNVASDAATAAAVAALTSAETRNFWQGHRFLNFLLACMVFAFVISWLFHFNVPS